MRRDRKRRYHLLLSQSVAQMVKAEATTRMVSVSAFVEELLCRALNVKPSQGGDTEDVSERSRRGQSRRCRVSLNDVIWERLQAEAGRRGLAVVRIIRDLLCQSLFGEVKVAADVTRVRPSSEHEGESGGSATLGLDVKGGDF